MVSLVEVTNHLPSVVNKRGRGRPKALNDQQAQEIRDLHGLLTVSTIANRYGVKPGVIKWVWARAYKSGSGLMPLNGAAIRHARINDEGFICPPVVEFGEINPVPPDEITDAGKSLVDLNTNECHWPIGVDSDGHFRFCGCGCSATYCTAHKALAFTAVETFEVGDLRLGEETPLLNDEADDYLRTELEETELLFSPDDEF